MYICTAFVTDTYVHMLTCEDIISYKYILSHPIVTLLSDDFNNYQGHMTNQLDNY